MVHLAHGTIELSHGSGQEELGPMNTLNWSWGQGRVFSELEESLTVSAHPHSAHSYSY